MGPKKASNQDSFRNKIRKCLYYDRGFCKYAEKCNKHHPDKVCSDPNCFDDNCDSRHPNPCKFGPRCKFNRTNVYYVPFACDDGKEHIKELENKILALEKENKSKTKNTGFEDLAKKVEKKLEAFENQVKTLQKALEEKDSKLVNMEKEMGELRNSLKKKEKELDNKINEIDEQRDNLVNETITDLEKSLRGFEKEIFECDECKFTTESKRGLKVHVKRKHIQNKEEDFPLTCDFCEHRVFDCKGMERHLKQHSYKKLTYKCEDCEYLASDELTLEVHSGKVHSGIFECALCGYQGSDLENLELHLGTCETFECKYCNLKLKNVGEVENHLEKVHPKHQKHTDILNTKMSRKNSETVSQRTWTGSSLIAFHKK